MAINENGNIDSRVIFACNAKRKGISNYDGRELATEAVCSW